MYRELTVGILRDDSVIYKTDLGLYKISDTTQSVCLSRKEDRFKNSDTLLLIS